MELSDHLAARANNDGAVVVIQPSTGNILAMVSKPTYDPNALVGTAWPRRSWPTSCYNQRPRRLLPLAPIATGETFAPGSTMKVVTSTAAYNLKPPWPASTTRWRSARSSPTRTNPLCDQSGPCGGDMTQMLPFSCDPGYGELGSAGGRGHPGEAGRALRVQQGSADRPAPPRTPGRCGGFDLRIVAGELAGASWPTTPSVSTASRPRPCRTPWWPPGIANGGQLMTPHLMTSIQNSLGNTSPPTSPRRCRRCRPRRPPSR